MKQGTNIEEACVRYTGMPVGGDLCKEFMKKNNFPDDADLLYLQSEDEGNSSLLHQCYKPVKGRYGWCEVEASF